MNTAVHLDEITRRFPGVVANDDVDLTVERGTVHALLGENGTGKTTLVDIPYGLYEPTEGTVHADRKPRDFDSPADVIDAGIGMIHQYFMLVDPMTVAENIIFGSESRKWFGTTVDRERAHQEVIDFSNRYGFDVNPDDAIEDVSVGVQQRVEILKALYCGADILILDEPIAVLTPQEVEELFRVFEELVAQGRAIIFTSHKLGEAMHVANDVTVFRNGKSVGIVKADETSNEELAELMAGREVLFESKAEPQEPGDEVLSVQRLPATGNRGVPATSDVSFDICEGEVFGIAGVDGNGQSQLIEVITGLRTPTEDSISYRGRDITDAPRRSRIDDGMACVPEDRHERELMMDPNLVQDGILGSQHSPPFAVAGRMHWSDAREHTERIIDEYDVRPSHADADIESFSGGNQQKFIVGREFERGPDFVVATHPTHGVDIGAMEFIHERLLDLQAEGKAILLISSKLDEVQGLSDRLGVMHDGGLMDIVDPRNTTEEEISLLMTGERPDTGAIDAGPPVGDAK